MRILSVDPGSINTGISILELDKDNNIKIIFVDTFNAKNYLKLSKDILEIHGSRFTRINGICNYFNKIIDIYKPDCIASEAPFYNPKNPGAYGALVEVVTSLKLTAFNLDNTLPFELIPPSNVKNAFGVNGGSGDKELMRLALSKLNISYELSSFDSLDEHSIDSIAVGVAKIKELIK